MKPATWPLRFGAGGVLAVGTAGAMLTLSAVAPAGAATTPPNKVVVPQAITVKGLHASRISAAAASTKETVSFVLKTRNTAKLEADVEAGMPSGYLSVSKFANYYGQSQANVSALEAYLKTFGIKSSAYKDRLNISTTGTIADYNKALDVSQSMYRVAAAAAHGTTAAQPAQVFHGTTNNATLPASLGRFVYSDPRPDQLRDQRQRARGTRCCASRRRARGCSWATAPRRTSPSSTASTRSTPRAPRARARPSASSPTPASGRPTRRTSGSRS